MFMFVGEWEVPERERVRMRVRVDWGRVMGAGGRLELGVIEMLVDSRQYAELSK
jgi:hypothetical protein